MHPIASHQEIKLGTVQLNVAEVERSLHFYQALLHLEVAGQFGNTLIFLSTDGHHHIALDTWSRREAALPTPEGHHGLYHFSILFPERHALAWVIKRLIDGAYPVDGAFDFGAYEAIYLRDPDGIPVELYRIIPKEEKTVRSGTREHPRSIDLESLLAELR